MVLVLVVDMSGLRTYIYLLLVILSFSLLFWRSPVSTMLPVLGGWSTTAIPSTEYEYLRHALRQNMEYMTDREKQLVMMSHGAVGRV